MSTQSPARTRAGTVLVPTALLTAGALVFAGRGEP